MRTNLFFRFAIILIIPVFLIALLSAMETPQQKGSVPTTINDFFLPGSQPLESGTFVNPDQCDNCHGNYNENVEPDFNWKGSMMSQAQRDPLYLACLTIANQDAPEVGDLCIRCHTPKGWLEGRSEPTDGSALTIDDRKGITCHFCHKMIAPTSVGINPYPNDLLYITEIGNIPSTYNIDQLYLPGITSIPETTANGSYVCDDVDRRRGPYFDPQANHDTPYSPFHSDSKLCGTCHDVSNPVYETVRDLEGNIIGYQLGEFDQPAASFNPYDMFPVERTFSEWSVSEYNTPGGFSGTYFGGNKTFVSSCQDCHMRDVTGKGCNKQYAPVRDDLPLHDMTGGNTFISTLIELIYPGETDPVAISAAVVRARDMLQHAASMDIQVDQFSAEVSVTITNETGHKLPSGYPEGRRIWINLKAWNSVTAQSFESGYYDAATGVLDEVGTKIYQIKPGLSPGIAAALDLPAGPSFHFVLSDTIYSDNRIPPRGFNNANFDSIQSPPVAYTYEDGQYWDETIYQLPFIPDSVEVSLFYQTTTKEYVEFLRDENVTNSAGQLMYDLWDQNGKSHPELMNYVTWSGEILHAAVLDIEVLLEGPFSAGLMSTDLNSKGQLPLSQPYNISPWNYTGDETVTFIPDPGIVDWVLVELRETSGDASTATSSTVVDQRAGFLLTDGKITDLDGINPLQFNAVITQNLFVVVWHRNHLGIMSSIALSEDAGVYSYNFSLGESQVYGGAAGYKEISVGVWGMVGADADANGIIDISDKTVNWMNEVGLSGYYSADFNLDVNTDNKDKNEIWLNNIQESQVPENSIGAPLKYFQSKVPL
jgi:hypothetical protein